MLDTGYSMLDAIRDRESSIEYPVSSIKIIVLGCNCYIAGGHHNERGI